MVALYGFQLNIFISWYSIKMHLLLLFLVKYSCVQEIGSTDAFNCPELDLVLAEVQKVEQWKQHCENIVAASAGEAKLLITALLEVYIMHLFHCFEMFDNLVAYFASVMNVSGFS